MGEPVIEARSSVADLADRLDDADLSSRTTGPRTAQAAADGRLADLGRWIAGVLDRPPERVRLVVLGEPPELVAQTAESLGIAVRAIHVGHVIDTADTARADSISTAIASGVAAADAVADENVDLVLLAAGADELQCAAAIGALTAAEPVALLPRGAAAVDTSDWIRRATYLRDTQRLVSGQLDDPDELLMALGSPTLAAATAFALVAAARRTPTVLDGLAAAAAVLIAAQSHPRARRWWLLADTSSDIAHGRAADDLGATPVLGLELARGDGLAALLATPVLRAAFALTASAEIAPAPGRTASAS